MDENALVELKSIAKSLRILRSIAIGWFASKHTSSAERILGMLERHERMTSKEDVT